MTTLPVGLGTFGHGLPPLRRASGLSPLYSSPGTVEDFEAVLVVDGQGRLMTESYSRHCQGQQGQFSKACKGTAQESGNFAAEGGD